jgi:hypothetical protein
VGKVNERIQEGMRFIRRAYEKMISASQYSFRDYAISCMNRRKKGKRK